MSCDCDYGICTDSPDCPVHQTPASQSRNAFTRYCEASRQACAEPYQCGHQCRIEAAKLTQRQGGEQVDDGLPIKMFEPPRRFTWLYVFVAAGSVLAASIGIYWRLI